VYGSKDYVFNEQYILALRFSDFTPQDHLREIVLWILPAWNFPNDLLGFGRVPAQLTL
jgi:hypothetical protein